MRVTANTKLIRRRARLGTTVSMFGLVVLILGFIASFVQPQLVWAPLISIAVGLLAALIGGYNTRRFARSPRPDQVIETALKGFDDRYHYYAWALPVSYVLLAPQGVYTFVTRDQTGQIAVTGSRWKRKFSLSQVLLAFAQEGFGNPTSDALLDAERLTKWIREKLPDRQVSAQPAVVFIDERAQLNITEPAVPVLDAKGVKKWLRGPGKGDNLKAADLKALEELFDAHAATKQ